MSDGPPRTASDDCAQEQIHKLGCIQAFGALLAVTTNWTVAHCSANIGKILGIAPDQVLGENLCRLMTAAGFGVLKQASQRLECPDAVERMFGVELIEGMPPFDIALHTASGFIIVEVEPHDQHAFNSHVKQLRPIVQRMEAIGSSEELFRQSVIMLQGLLGFDRIMAYNFRGDGTGEVVAEARLPELPPFKGLRFPPSDIPTQARALYFRNQFRIIADVEAEPIAILSALDAPANPLDLSMSVLRAVSPTHILYLKNMGVGASLSISIIHGGKLIGLFVCQNVEPRELPFSVRTIAELYSQLFSLNLDRTLIESAQTNGITADKLGGQLRLALKQGRALIDNLIRNLIEQSRNDAIDVDNFTELVGGRIGALAGAHDTINQKNWAPAPILQMMQTEAQRYANGSVGRFRFLGKDALLAPSAYTALALVVHEMTTNAAKYGSLSVPNGSLHIQLQQSESGDLHIAWRERGGPSPKQPSRRGFGSAVIEHAIPFEIKGKAEMRFDPQGLEADFVIPARYVSRPDQSSASLHPPLSKPARIPEAQTATISSMPRHALVVDDSMIIALDASQTLQFMGVETIDTHGDVAGALAAIKARKPDFAIIDINLGSETSSRVTKELNRLNVPFVLATGYSESTIQSARSGAFSILRKPYGRAEIAGVLNALQNPRYAASAEYEPAA